MTAAWKFAAVTSPFMKRVPDIATQIALDCTTAETTVKQKIEFVKGSLPAPL